MVRLNLGKNGKLADRELIAKAAPKSRNGCGWECCPSGFIEHVKNYRYSRWAYGATFWSYWKWEFECWIGMHQYKPKKGCKYCAKNECYEHDYFSEEANQ